MPRLPYLPEEIDEPREIVDAIRARRRGMLLNLDRMLLHSPPFAEGWNNLLGAVRGKLSLPPRTQELAICAVAIFTEADYEYHHHAPAFLQAGGTQEELTALRLLSQGGDALLTFSADDRAVVGLARDMTLEVQVSDACIAAVRKCLADDRQLNELIGVIACYNMVSRYLVALQVQAEAD